MIFIHSHKRSDNVLTFEQIPKYYRRETKIVVRTSQYELYKQHYGDHVVPVNIIGIPGTKDWMLQYAINHKLEKIIMMDDDIKLFSKPKPNQYVPINSLSFHEMITELLENCTNEVPVVGLPHRAFSHNIVAPIDLRYLANLYVIYIPVIEKTGIRFSWGHLYSEDTYFIIKILSAKYKTRILSSFCLEHKMFSEGGCNDERTEELFVKTIFALAKQFPKYASVHIKRNSTLNDPLSKRIALRVNWKQIYNEAKCD